MNYFSEIKLDRTSPLPLFYQLAEELRRIIESAPADFKLPSERKISEMLHVDRSTVTKAFARLHESGLITRQTPKIWQVCAIGKERQISAPPCIGIVIPDKFARIDKDNYLIIAEYFKGFFDAANEKNISIAMFQLPDANSRSAGNAGFIRNLARQVIGIIHLGDRILSLDSPLQQLMKNKELPQVLISAETQYDHILQVIPDELPGTEKLEQRLKKLNIRKIGVITHFDSLIPPKVNPYAAYSSFKRDSFLWDFFRSRNFICDDKWNIFKCDSYPAVLENIRNKKAAGSLPQLFCCHNDIIAAWVIQACGELNIDIPGNLSVVGFNGMPLPEYNGLATIQHPFYGIGHAAVCELLERHRNPRHTSGNVVKIATGFIDGKTLGKPYHN